MFVVCLLSIVTTRVHAQIVQNYLADKSLTAAHLSVGIEGETASPQSWWRKVWSYVGIRSSERTRPEIGTTLHVISSAYASSPYQTDATPCTTAAGTTVRPGVVATNFLPLGTIISVAGKRYIVEDRMNSRYDGYYMDIWFPSTSEALEFGRKKLPITIIEYAEPGAAIESPLPQIETKEEKKTIWKTIGDSVAAIGHLLITKTYSDPNKYDIDCTN